MRLSELATDMGDLLCVTAVAGVVAFWCWQQLDRLAAAAFVVTYALASCLTAGLKMISASVLTPLHRAGDFELSRGAPSGHVALSVVVYGSAAYLCGKASRGWEARLGQAACLLVIAAIAITRITLHAHTIADVIAGLVLGVLILILPITLVWSRPSPYGVTGSARWLVAGMAAVGMFMLASGVRMPSRSFRHGPALELIEPAEFRDQS